MGCSSKGLVLALILAMAISSLSFLMVKPADARAIPTPSVPEFTLRYDKASYDVTDPYTGASQQVDNSTIRMTVKNQPFNVIYDARDNITTSLYYNVQVKGHFAENWTEAFSTINYSVAFNNSAYSRYNYPIQSNSDFTTISLPANYPTDSKVDFRVQAVIANQTEVYLPDFIPIIPVQGEYTPETVMFIVQTSDWSGTQTVTLTESLSSSTPTQTVPEFSRLTIVPLLLSVFSVAVIVSHRKTLKSPIIL